MKLGPVILQSLPTLCILRCIVGLSQTLSYIHCVPKSDAKIEITITMAHLIRINYPLSSFNYRFSGTNVANFNKIHHIVSEQQLLKKMELKNRIFQYGKYRLGYLLQKVLRML